MSKVIRRGHLGEGRRRKERQVALLTQACRRLNPEGKVAGAFGGLPSQGFSPRRSSRASPAVLM